MHTARHGGTRVILHGAKAFVAQSVTECISSAKVAALYGLYSLYSLYSLAQLVGRRASEQHPEAPLQPLYSHL